MGEGAAPKVPSSGPPAAAWVTPGKAPADPVFRVALIATVLWLLLGLGSAFVSTRLGAPQTSAALALLSGVPALLIAGRGGRLDSRGGWVRAVAITLVFAFLLFGAGIFVYTILLYG